MAAKELSPGLSLMKIPLSITLSFPLVAVAAWLACGSVRKEGPSHFSPGSSSREVQVPRDFPRVVNPASAEVRFPHVAPVDAGDVTSAARFPGRSSSLLPDISGASEKLPGHGGRRFSPARAERSAAPASSLPGSDNLVPAGGPQAPVVATQTLKVIPKAVADPSEPVRQPAAWVDLGETSALTPSEQEEVQAAAVALHEQIAASGLDPDSPEYRDLWEKAVADSDRMFRQRFGGRAWVAHHIQAFHLGQVTAAP